MLNVQNLHFYDISYPLPFHLTNKQQRVNLKVPALNVAQLFFIIDKFLHIEIKNISAIHKYNLVQSRGYTQPIYKQIELIQGENLRKARIYYNNHLKNGSFQCR